MLLRSAAERLDAVCQLMGTGNGERGIPRSLLRLPFMDGGDVYEFGVGRYATGLRQLADLFNNTGARLWGFDTFAGIPAEEEGVTNIAAFAAGEMAPSESVAETVRRFERDIPTATMVPGPFNETLSSPRLARDRRMRPATLVDLDADLYSSTRDALRWLLRSGLLVRGTVVAYDDFYDISCVAADGSEAYANHGEARAHFEFASEHRVAFRCVCGACSTANLHTGGKLRAYLVVDSIGGRADSGVTLSAADHRRLVRTHPYCAKLRARNQQGVFHGGKLNRSTTPVRPVYPTTRVPVPVPVPVPGPVPRAGAGK